MPNVDTQEIKEYAGKITERIPTFQTALKGLRDISDELRESPLDGQFGTNGYYNSRLSRFGSKLMEVLDEFVEDDKRFVAFLQQFAENMNHVAGNYEHIESDNTQHLSNLTRRLDGEA